MIGRQQTQNIQELKLRFFLHLQKTQLRIKNFSRNMKTFSYVLTDNITTSKDKNFKLKLLPYKKNQDMIQTNKVSMLPTKLLKLYLSSIRITFISVPKKQTTFSITGGQLFRLLPPQIYYIKCSVVMTTNTIY